MNPLVMLGLKILGFVAYMLIESWMGKTDKISSGSVLELVCSSLLAILKTLGINPKSQQEIGK